MDFSVSFILKSNFWKCFKIGKQAIIGLILLVLSSLTVMQVQAAQVLFLVGNATTLSTGDKAVRDTLVNMGHTLTVKLGSSSIIADTAGKALIVISSTLAPTDIGTRFLNVQTPILTWENGLFNTLFMTASVLGTDYGFATVQTAIKIQLATHSMAAGLTGTPTILSASDSIAWGKPSNSAFKIAMINSATVADSSKVVIFGYEVGTTMVGQNATGRRLGFFLDGDAATRWNTSGKNLFRAAVNWAITGSAPWVTSQPVAPSVSEGVSATFTVAALGAIPLAYQWRANGVNIPGALSASYTKTTTTMADSGIVYSCIVSNSVGSVISGNAILRVNPIVPSVTQSPASVTINENQTASFSVVAIGTAPLSYQWKKGGNSISGATLASYTSPINSMADSAASFTCTVTNRAGSVTSAAAILTVRALPPQVQNITSNSPVREGDSAIFEISHIGTPPFSYQWKRGGTNIVGANLIRYKIVTTAMSDNNAVFRCVVTGRGGKDSSANITLTVNPVPIKINRQPLSRTVYEGQKASFNLSVIGTLPISFQWQRNGISILGAVDSIYTTPMLQIADSGAFYTCLITNGAGTLASQSAIVSVRRYAQFPVSQWIGISAELRDDLGNLIGKGIAVDKDMVIKLFTSATGMVSIYQEDFTSATGQPISVKDGFFTLYLGSGMATDNLNQILTDNPSLFAEVSVGSAASLEVLQPRTPVTAPAYQGAPQILHGSGNPIQIAPAGTYYENTVNGTVWMRLPVRWIQVSNP
jgi:hypothetical protein